MFHQSWPQSMKEDRFLCAVYHHFRYKARRQVPAVSAAAVSQSAVAAAVAAAATMMPTNGALSLNELQIQMQLRMLIRMRTRLQIKKAISQQQQRQQTQLTVNQNQTLTQQTPAITLDKNPDRSNTHSQTEPTAVAGMKERYEDRATATTANNLQTPGTAIPIPALPNASSIPEHLKYEALAEFMLQLFPSLRVCPTASVPDVMQRYFDASSHSADLKKAQAQIRLQEAMIAELKAQIEIRVQEEENHSRKRTMDAHADPPVVCKRQHVVDDSDESIPIKMTINSRNDVPDDVKRLVKRLRLDHYELRRKHKSSLSRIEKLDAKYKETREELVQAKKMAQQKQPPKPATVSVPIPPPAADASSSSSEDEGTIAFGSTDARLRRMFRPAEQKFTWCERLAELEHFIAVHGHACVPVKDPILGNWTDRIRAEYKAALEVNPNIMHEPNRPLANMYPYPLNRDRIEHLQKLGFDFDSGPQEGMSWDQRFLQLKQFRQRFGHAFVPRYCKENPWLGEFCYQNRKKRRKNRLTREQIKKLDSVGFPWEFSSMVV